MKTALFSRPGPNELGVSADRFRELLGQPRTRRPRIEQVGRLGFRISAKLADGSLAVLAWERGDIKIMRSIDVAFVALRNMGARTFQVDSPFDRSGCVPTRSDHAMVSRRRRERYAKALTQRDSFLREAQEASNLSEREFDDLLSAVSVPSSDPQEQRLQRGFTLWIDNPGWRTGLAHNYHAAGLLFFDVYGPFDRGSAGFARARSTPLYGNFRFQEGLEDAIRLALSRSTA